MTLAAPRSGGGHRPGRRIRRGRSPPAAITRHHRGDRRPRRRDRGGVGARPRSASASPALRRAGPSNANSTWPSPPLGRDQATPARSLAKRRCFPCRGVDSAPAGCATVFGIIHDQGWRWHRDRRRLLVGANASPANGAGRCPRPREVPGPGLLLGRSGCIRRFCRVGGSPTTATAGVTSAHRNRARPLPAIPMPGEPRGFADRLARQPGVTCSTPRDVLGGGSASPSMTRCRAAGGVHFPERWRPSYRGCACRRGSRRRAVAPAEADDPILCAMRRPRWRRPPSAVPVLAPARMTNWRSGVARLGATPFTRPSARPPELAAAGHRRRRRAAVVSPAMSRGSMACARRCRCSRRSPPAPTPS